MVFSLARELVTKYYHFYFGLGCEHCDADQFSAFSKQRCEDIDKKTRAMDQGTDIAEDIPIEISREIIQLPVQKDYAELFVHVPLFDLIGQTMPHILHSGDTYAVSIRDNVLISCSCEYFGRVDQSISVT